jgi:hypothetical protein
MELTIVPGLKITLLQQPLVWMDGPPTCAILIANWKGLPGAMSLFYRRCSPPALPWKRQNSLYPKPTWWRGCMPGAQTQALIAGSAALQTERGAVNRFLLVEPDGTVHHYDKRHLFRMADEHHHYEAGNERVVFEWRGWRILPLVCYDLRFPVWSRNLNDYDLALYVANWPAPRSCTGSRCWSPARLRTRPTSPAVTGSAPTATVIITAAIAGLSVPRGRLSPPPIRIRPPVLMPNCR